jgi:hypothetical protein
VVGCCEHGNIKLLGSLGGDKFFDKLRDYQLPKQDSALWLPIILRIFGRKPGDVSDKE